MRTKLKALLAIAVASQLVILTLAIASRTADIIEFADSGARGSAPTPSKPATLAMPSTREGSAASTVGNTKAAGNQSFSFCINGAGYLPDSIADPASFARSMDARYGTASLDALKSSIESLKASLPSDLGYELHWAKVNAGDGTIVGRMKLLPGGLKQYTVPEDFLRDRSLYLDQITRTEGGAVLITTIGLQDIAPYADRVAEINWLRKAFKNRRRG